MLFTPRHQLTELRQYVGHAHCCGKFPNPLARNVDFGIGMRGKKAFDILQVLGTTGTMP